MTSGAAGPPAPGPLDELHAGARATFTEAWGRRVVAAFSSDAAAEARLGEESVALLDQTWRGTIDVRGEAVLEVLDRILSSAVARLTPGGAGQLAALLSPKGKLAGVVQLFREADDHLRMRLEEPCRDALVRELEKYAFLSDVSVAPSLDDVALALRGPRAGDAIRGPVEAATTLAEPWSRVVGRVGDAPVEVVRVGPERTDTRAGGYDVWVARSSAAAVWAELALAVESVGGGPAGWLALEALRIDAGFTRHGIDYHDDAFPAEAGKEHVLSYDKCYVGQEVVARMKTYGSANRRFVRVEVSGDAPEPGAEVRSGDALAGRVTSATPLRLGGAARALARVKRRFLDADGFEVDVAGTPARCRLLPLHGDEDREG